MHFLAFFARIKAMVAMTRKEKEKMRASFFRKVGPNAETFKAMMDALPDVGFYFKDVEGRIMALNKRNCDYCNIRDEFDAIGSRSDGLFPNAIAKSFMDADDVVRATGKPVIGQVHRHPADRSMDVHVKSVFPVSDRAGKLVGTAGIYYKRPGDGAPDWHGRMKAVTEWVSRHYAESISMSQLAEIAGTSEPNFRRQFARVFGVSAGRYVTTIRLNAARKLLETSDRLVSDIAIATGFFDQSHFSKAFKRERGITPGEYRARRCAAE